MPNAINQAPPTRPQEPNFASYARDYMTEDQGHRIMVHIQSFWFPLVARNPQKFLRNYKLGVAADFQKATQRVYLGGRHRSVMILPVFKR